MSVMVVVIVVAVRVVCVGLAAAEGSLEVAAGGLRVVGAPGLGLGVAVSCVAVAVIVVVVVMVQVMGICGKIRAEGVATKEGKVMRKGMMR